ncbi:potassium/proton antiporter [Flammeovirga kamogawensis]|uniref:Potassium/proton antiporter n=1 Tax=Flammeovirga kamogawensis TaxID=373891 RepID=A0ABX8GRL9_9BACT|nr:potassium/proton antiporter [Flammeovirga kamogawensis]MBB6462716.1 cell volume regulation protein A [Flammeovirga kamogawensis]QWG06051.1 potassium/proton antiporter [Flammeovirga kamogawensis]TRX67883.1 potassium/proton antiporter [Flammeovirga kamogawensis]
MLGNEMTLLIAVLIIIGILLYNPTKDLGIPAAFIFIGVGLFLGNGESSFEVYDNPELSEFISQTALVLIIFVGGLHTKVLDIKKVIKEGILVSNIGVIVTSLTLGVFVSYVTPLSLLEGLLLGSIVSSTDAAAVFGVLEAKKMKLKFASDKVLEFESATNDPMAMILTLIFVSILQNPDSPINYVEYIQFFVQQIFIGGGLAFTLFHIVKFLFKKFHFQEEGLIPILLFSSLIVFLKVNEYLGGNALIGAYIFGVLLNTLDYQNKDNSLHFFNSFSWLAQSIMFLILGLQMFPRSLWEVLPIAILPALFLFFIARPLGIFLSYLPLKEPLNKKIFISWSGLKGATPIVFALIPILSEVNNADMIFYITSFIVLLSLIVHPFSMEFLAKKVHLLEDE